MVRTIAKAAGVSPARPAQRSRKLQMNTGLFPIIRRARQVKLEHGIREPRVVDNSKAEQLAIMKKGAADKREPVAQAAAVRASLDDDGQGMPMLPTGRTVGRDQGRTYAENKRSKAKGTA